jgi:hypothetical protein
MKKYKSPTANKGTTIILPSVAEAIHWGREYYKNPDKKFEDSFWYSPNEKNKKEFEACVAAITQGNQGFKNQCEEIIDDVIDLIDSIKPIFSMNRSGIKFEEDAGHTISPELAAMGDPKCLISDKKHNEELEVRKGTSGEGAYRIIINTDVSWWGKPEDNCALVGALIIVLQRFATVEVWIQQGWLGPNEEDGVTLFKLDYTTAADITALVFWISHRGKDIPFSMAVNRGLGRKSTATSCRAEIEADIMLRGDWQNKVGLSYSQVASLMYTEKIDAMAHWISETAYKTVFNGPEDGGEWISEERK